MSEREKQDQLVQQCKVVAHLANAIMQVHLDLADIYEQIPHTDAQVDHVGNRTARLMETLGDVLNGMDAVDAEEDGWVNPVFEEARRLFPNPGGDGNE